MPLITIKTKPDTWLLESESRGQTVLLREVAEKHFGRSLPDLFVSHKKALCLEEETTAEHVQVEHGTFGLNDVNTPDLGIFVQFTETIENTHTLDRIRNRLVDMLAKWFDENGFAMPNCALDIKWGPMRGAFWTPDGFDDY